MTQALKLRDLVHCDIECLKFEVVFKAFKLMNLVLLQIKLFEVDQGLKP